MKNNDFDEVHLNWLRGKNVVVYLMGSRDPRRIIHGDLEYDNNEWGVNGHPNSAPNSSRAFWPLIPGDVVVPFGGDNDE